MIARLGYVLKTSGNEAMKVGFVVIQQVSWICLIPQLMFLPQCY